MRRIKYFQRVTNDEGEQGFEICAGYQGQKPDIRRRFFGDSAKDRARDFYSEVR
jgi:hypothetical protein